MRVIQLATEFAPFAKAGGLGEVIVGLSRELRRLSIDVEVILPKYSFIDPKKLERLVLEVADFKCIEKGNAHANAMWKASYEGIPLHLLEVRHSSGYFHRDHIYGYEDDAARFLYFSKAALEFLKLSSKPIDILHVHDWHTAGAAILAKDLFHLPIGAIVLTVHNGEYQGKCASWDLDAIGLPSKEYLNAAKLQDNDPLHPKLINLLKGGIVYADMVNTVSPSYAKEILTKEFGFGLDPTFRKHKHKLRGILNGLDLALWNPDYSAQDPFSKIGKAKKSAKESLQKEFGLKSNGLPWVGAITRIATQKGPQLLEEALIYTLEAGGTFLLLGSCPDPKLRAKLEQVHKKYQSTGRLLMFLKYDEALARPIYQALDFLVIPSLYEPCGLTQMIAMRYGTIPIVRATGGLKDTVFDCDDLHVLAGQKNGFVFPNYSTISMRSALNRAISTFHNDPEKIETLVHNGMKMDWSWTKPAQAYLEMYKAATSSL